MFLQRNIHPLLPLCAYSSHPSLQIVIDIAELLWLVLHLIQSDPSVFKDSRFALADYKGVLMLLPDGRTGILSPLLHRASRNVSRQRLQSRRHFGVPTVLRRVRGLARESLGLTRGSIFSCLFTVFTFDRRDLK